MIFSLTNRWPNVQHNNECHNELFEWGANKVKLFSKHFTTIFLHQEYYDGKIVAVRIPQTWADREEARGPVSNHIKIRKYLLGEIPSTSACPMEKNASLIITNKHLYNTNNEQMPLQFMRQLKDCFIFFTAHHPLKVSPNELDQRTCV